MAQANVKKRMTIMVLALAIVFGGLVGFNLFKAHMIKKFFASYQPPAVSISSVKAKKQQWNPEINAVGNFVAINGVDVNSEASGNVVAIRFKSGEYVTKGTPLIQLDDSVDQATLKDNQASLALKEISYKRQSELFKRGANSSSDVDEAKANLEQAQALTDKTKAIISQKHIKAPFSGKLGIRRVNLGQFISPGNTTIVTLQSLDPLFLEFHLPEHEMKNLYVGQEIRFQVDSWKNALFQGKITALNSKIDTNTHNIQVQATVANCPLIQPDNLKTTKDGKKLLKISTDGFSNKKLIQCNTQLNQSNEVQRFAFNPGMFANISVIQPVLKDVIVLPRTAISYSLFGNSVFVIEKDAKKKDKNGKPILTVKRVFVHTGEERGNYVVVTAGVKAGQEIVSSGQLKLQNGTRVVINNSVSLKDIPNPEKLGQ